MSSEFIKTTYLVEGSWGVPDKETLYAKFNYSTGFVDVYNDEGYLFTDSITIENNLLTALNRLYSILQKDDLPENTSYVSDRELDKIKAL